MVQKALFLAGCCHDLDTVLTSDIQIDQQYVNEVKDFFLERAHPRSKILPKL